MVEQLQKLSALSSRRSSQGTRLLAALTKDKAPGGRHSGAGATPAYRSIGQANAALPFPSLVAPCPVVPSMPSRAPTSWDDTNVRGADYRDAYDLPDDDEDEENSNPAAASGKVPGVTVGKRGVLGGSEPRKQANLPMLFSRENKRLQAARLTPAGMVNLGNTCYLNSVVQVLLNMASFVADLRDPTLERLSQHLPVTGVWASLRTTADKLRTATLARPTFDSLKPAVEPSELRAAMGRRSSRWRSFAQQDAHEFLVELLEALQNDVLAAEAASSGRRRMPLSKTRCPVARNLSGSLVHTWTCSACGRCTRLKEPFSCLSLQLPPQGTVNLQDMISEYLKEEAIDKHCEGCSPSAPVPHTAQHHFWRLPRVLVVHIKRFMPLPQPKQPPQQAAPAQPPQRQGPVGGNAAEALPAAPATDEPGATPQASSPILPGTPGRDDTATAREQVAAAALAAPKPSAAGSREPTPPAPYVYAKVHTEVKVTPGLDLARHCDAVARAHAHLLECLSSASLTPRIGDGDDGAAAGGSGAQPGGRADVAVGAGGATPPSRLPGVTAGGTLDTAGGGSTCPSPSFMQPNASALQERTVQQNGAVAPKDLRQRVLLARSKALTPGASRLPAPESECGTSAVSTGAQTDAGNGAPTPHGGVCAAAARPGSLLRQSDQERKRSPLGNGGGSASAAPPSAQGGLLGLAKCIPAALKPERGFGSTPQAALRLVSKLLGVGYGACKGTPMPASLGDGLSSHTGNDRAAPQPESAACGGESAAQGCSADAVACSERKAPRPMDTGAFFGTAAEPRSGGGGQGPLRRSSGGGASQQGNGEAPARPLKRMCVETAAAAGTPTEKGTSEPPCPPTALMAPRRIEDMTEEEQLELALQMSMAAEAGAAAVTGSGPVGPRPAGTVLGVFMPTAAFVQRPGHGGAGAGSNKAQTCVSGDSADSGQAAGCAPRADQAIEGAGCDDRDLMVELQDESQGGTGQARSGEDGRGSLDGARPTNSSGPAMSGASGGRNDGNESDCSADLAYRAGTALDRRNAARTERRRKRRVGNFFHREDVLAVAESPALPPRQQQQRRRAGSGYGGDGCGRSTDASHRPVACSIEDEEDGAAELSPVSGSEKRSAAAGAGATERELGAGTRGRAVEGTSARDVEMVPADDEQDPEMAEALRLSRATYEAEVQERKLRVSMGGAAAEYKSGTDAEWDHVLSIPDVDENDAAGAAAGAGGCSTPKRGVAAPAAAESPTRPLRKRASMGGIDMDDDDGRGAGGMDALVAAAGLGADGLSLGDTVGLGTTRRRPQSFLRGSGSDAGHDNANGASEGPFKFSFKLPEASSASAGAGAGTSTAGPAEGGGHGLGGPGTRREEPLDLTGGDDEDADLHKAIMLSLQVATVQDVAMADAAVDAGPPLVMDLASAGADGNDTSAVEPIPEKPKALLVPDSDYDGDSGDEGDKSNSGAGAVEEPAAAADAAAARARKSQRPGCSKRAAQGSPALSVPLAQMARYRLHGVVRHKGPTPFSGHYVADALVTNLPGAAGQPSHMWYEHNDAAVSHVDFERVREDAAKQGYLFFFVNHPRPTVSMAAAVAAAAAKPLPDSGGAGTGAVAP